MECKICGTETGSIYDVHPGACFYQYFRQCQGSSFIQEKEKPMKCKNCGKSLAPKNHIEFGITTVGGACYCNQACYDEHMSERASEKGKPMLSKEEKKTFFRLIDGATETVRRIAFLSDKIDICPYPVAALNELYKFKEELMDKFIADDGVKNV